MSSRSPFRLRVLLGLILALGVLAPSAEAQWLKPKEALELAFPKAEITRSSINLSKEQRRQAEKLAGHKLKSSKVRSYKACLDEKWQGTAYFDTRKVRSKAQTLMIVVAPDGTVKRIETIRFDEPREYAASAKWQATLLGKKLDKHLKIKGSINNMTGATLTARATVNAVRSVLAVHAVLNPSKPTPKPKPQSLAKKPTPPRGV